MTIPTMLRRAPLTATELARQLGISGNAVRAQLARLEADGVVERFADRRTTVGKPPYRYRLTERAETSLSRVYHRALAELIDILAGQLRAEETHSMLRALGKRLADGRVVGGRSVRERATLATNILSELGAVTEVAAGDGSCILSCYGCPLSTATTRYPDACTILESMLADMTGLDVRERCERTGNRARCRFELAERGLRADASGDPG